MRYDQPAGWPHDVAATIQKSRRMYQWWWTLAPSAVCAAIFAVLCSRECTALPWVMIVVGPVVGAAIGIAGGIWYWVWTSFLPEEERRTLRWWIVLSIFWGPTAAFAGFIGMVWLLTAVVGLFSWLF